MVRDLAVKLVAQKTKLKSVKTGNETEWEIQFIKLNQLLGKESLI